QVGGDDLPARGGHAVEAVEAGAVGVEVGQAGGGGAVHGAALDGDDGGVAAGLRARVGEHDVPVHLALDRPAVRAEQTLNGVAGVHARATRGGPHPGQGLGVAEDDGR